MLRIGVVNNLYLYSLVNNKNGSVNLVYWSVKKRTMRFFTHLDY
jgi:hypothetical protein